MQRVGAIAGRNDLVMSASRFLNGPLGASHGGDNGSALLMAVSRGGFQAATAVNNGARRGVRLLSRAGDPRKEKIEEAIVVRVAHFATRLWRTINGEPADPPQKVETGVAVVGVCAYDGILRSSLLALWQCIWSKACFAVLQVQAWTRSDKNQHYAELGAHLVMKISDDERAAAAEEENALSELNRLVATELKRQEWRGDMAKKAFDISRGTGVAQGQDVAAAEQGIGQPLPPINRDNAFRQGGWIASAAQQRRALSLDGGTAVKSVRLRGKASSDG